MSEKQKSAIDDEIAEILNAARQRVRNKLVENSELHSLLVTAVLEKNTLTQSDMIDILGQRNLHHQPKKVECHLSEKTEKK
jgi:ATP-dependent Zn protease